ncbi:CapA family protein [Anaerotignum faecicola]|nr:CapA family protein [Anaerotignum faecicola]
MINLKAAAVAFSMAFSGIGGGMGTAEEAIKTEISIIEESSDIKNEETSEVKLTFIGDIMCHSWQYNEAYNSETGEYDFNHNYQDVKKYFDNADLVIGNFETVLAGEGAGGYSDYPIFNSPDSFAEAMKNAGIDIVTTANNHCMDKRAAGLLRTIDVLDSLGIEHIGTYKSAEDRENILIKDVNGIKIAFLSYTYGTNGIPAPEGYLVNMLDENLIKNDISRAKAEGADFIVVLPHMGVEYETYTRDAYKEWADKMFEAGADIVVASHPHVLQPMEFKEVDNGDGTTRDCFVIYSMGNFISSQTTPPRNAGIILNINIKKEGEMRPEISQVSFVPIWTQFRNVNEQDHFIVRSVYEMLSLPDNVLRETVRKKDIDRLWQIHSETTSLLLGREVPYEQMKDEYIFEKVQNK